MAHRATAVVQRDANARAERLPSLTGLRFLAALLVFGFHLEVQGLLPRSSFRSALSFIFAQGPVGVSFFFILSGFVLTWSARPHDRMPAFWRRRAARILPNHVVTWFAAGCGLLLAGSQIPASVALLNLGLVQAWFPSERIHLGMNSPSWSLSCEAFFYLCFPVLLSLFRRLPTGRLWSVVAALLAIVTILPLGVVQVLSPNASHYVLYIFPVTRMLEFAIGIVLALILRQERWIRLPLWSATALAVSAYLASGHLPVAFRPAAGTVVPLALLIGAAANADLVGTRSLWRSRLMVRLGELSFAFYVVHQIVLRLTDNLAGDKVFRGLSGVLVAIATFAMSLLAAWALFLLVEQPSSRRFSTAKRRPGGGKAAVPEPCLRPGPDDVAPVPRPS